MHLLHLIHEGKATPAMAVENGAVPLRTLLEAPKSWPGVIALLHETDTRALQEKAAKAEAIPLQHLRHALPLSAENKVLCTGLNYTDHAKEGNQPIPEHPVFFTRYPSSFVAHGDAIRMPGISTKFDYEAELAIVIGKPVFRADEDEALAAIFGYTVAMDGSVRDIQRKHGQWTLGKNFDASGALGPAIASRDAVPRGAKGLSVTTRVNGELLQNGNTGDMIFPVQTLVSTISSVMTLNPGDIILTGTPAGVGFVRTPPVYLKPGDRVEVAVEGIGVLENGVATV